jgi:hypothetical protein
MHTPRCRQRRHLLLPPRANPNPNATLGNEVEARGLTHAECSPFRMLLTSHQRMRPLHTHALAVHSPAPHHVRAALVCPSFPPSPHLQNPGAPPPHRTEPFLPHGGWCSGGVTRPASPGTWPSTAATPAWRSGSGVRQPTAGVRYGCTWGWRRSSTLRSTASAKRCGCSPRCRVR